jgi:fatty acid synthase
VGPTEIESLSSRGVKSNKPDVVISGISGQYPLSDDIDAFKENLFTGVDMVTADEVRWPIGFHRLPSRNGKVYGMDQFDNEFFGISDEDAELMDPQDRLLMEEVYRAILDAGVDPKSLRGSNTGYFHGACYTETNRVFETAESVPENKFKALVTRIPRFLGLRGPVLDVDTACGSGLSAFSEAYHSVKNGICDQAIATASNTVIRPRISFQFKDLKMITKDGKCKCLDASADGYVRSEAVVATFLQRSTDAKRIYCYLLACRSNSDGYKEEGITFPSTKGQVQLLRDTYDVSSSSV